MFFRPACQLPVLAPLPLGSGLRRLFRLRGPPNGLLLDGRGGLRASTGRRFGLGRLRHRHFLLCTQIHRPDPENLLRDQRGPAVFQRIATRIPGLSSICRLSIALVSMWKAAERHRVDSTQLLRAFVLAFGVDGLLRGAARSARVLSSLAFLPVCRSFPLTRGTRPLDLEPTIVFSAFSIAEESR